MEDQSDDGRYVLTQGKNSPEDWIQRGNVFLENRIYEHAAHCFSVAKDSIRYTFATAVATGLDLKLKRDVAGRVTQEQELQFFKVLAASL